MKVSPQVETSREQRWLSCLAGRRAVWFACGLIALAVLAAYHACFSVPFLLDDLASITGNPTIRQLWPIGRVLSPPAAAVTVSGRPVVNLSLALNYALGGTAVWGYHALNLAVHILASLTMLGLVRRTLLKPALRERFGPMALPLGMAVALLWGLHPLQTESVTYVVQRAESLMGLFYLLTLYGFIRGTESPTRGWYILAVAACVLGMGSKEVMVSAPLMVWLYDRTFVAGTFWAGLRVRWRLYAALGSSWLVLAWVVMRTGELGSARAGFQTAVSWWAYGLTQLWAVGHYLCLTVWPHPLVFDYGTMLVTWATQVLPGVLVVGALVVGTIVSLRRWPTLGFVGCWFFAILAPTSSVLVLTGQTVAEHRMYLPLAAILTVVVLGVHAWLGRRSLVLWLALAVVSGLLTSRRNADYRDAVAIWSDTVAKTANNGRAHNNLGFALLHAGRVPEAIVHLERALQIEPDNAQACNNLGVALLQQGKVAEATDHYKRALQIDPEYAQAYNNLGVALLQQGKVAEAAGHYERAMQKDPDYAEAHYNLGLALFQLGRAREAIEQYEQALRLKPEYAEAQHNLAKALVQQGRVSDAIVHYEQTLRLHPEYAEAHYNLGVALAQQGRVREAVGHYAQALRLQPKYAEAHYYLGVALLQAGQMPEAIEHLEEALRLKPDQAEAHNNLGAALFQQSKVAEAAEHFEQTLHLQPEHAPAHYNLATALLQLHREAEAVGHLKQALRLQPGEVEVQKQLAWVLATCRDAKVRNGVRAVELAEEASRLAGGKDAATLDTLAAAYAEAGRFGEAIRTAQAAIELAQTTGQMELAGTIRKRLQLYQAGRAYHEDAVPATGSTATP